MKIFPLFFLAMIFATSTLANSICRQPEVADFGSAVSSHADSSFVITQQCKKNHLVAKKPVHLSIHINQDAGTTKSITTSHSLPWVILFNLNEAYLDDSDRLIMNQIPFGSRVRVTGYTCSIGSKDYNDKLSLQRAEAVANYLRSHKVKIISISGRGECCPVSTTDLGKNRRVLIEEEK